MPGPQYHKSSLKYSYTLIEVIVVLVIAALLVALALPRINREGKRMIAENALTSIRNAVTETAMRSRATGTPLSLLLMPGDNEFIVDIADQNLAHVWVPPENAAISEGNAENGKTEAFFIKAKPSYELSNRIEWKPEEDNFDEEDNIVYYFYPDGQAAGHPLRFDVVGRHFQFDVDRITGAPLIMELEE